MKYLRASVQMSSLNQSHYLCQLSFKESVRLTYIVMVLIKETREGWTLLTAVETELNGDSNSTKERGPSLVGSLDSLCSYNRFLPCLGCFSQPSTKYKIPHRTLFTILVPIAQTGPAAVLGRLSLCLWFQ
jgi:hypothetical protein